MSPRKCVNYKVSLVMASIANQIGTIYGIGKPVFVAATMVLNLLRLAKAYSVH